MRFICSMEILTLYLEILHKINFFFLSGSWSIFILGDGCSAEERDSPAGFCSLSVVTGLPSQALAPTLALARPWGDVTIPATAPRGPAGLGVHSESFLLLISIFLQSQTTAPINQDNNAFHLE